MDPPLVLHLTPSNKYKVLISLIFSGIKEEEEEQEKSEDI
jgi:hypothetical protein